jgi:hypothetical protein
MKCFNAIFTSLIILPSGKLVHLKESWVLDYSAGKYVLPLVLLELLYPFDLFFSLTPTTVAR